MSQHNPGGPELPPMFLVNQKFQVPPVIDVNSELDRQWEELKGSVALKPGMEIAVCAGSRGITNLKKVVADVVAKLKDAGCRPFITPAMGSHGGATPEGQIEVLAARGITEETVGAPVRATVDVVPMGEVDGIPLFLDRLAHDADGIVLINRIKPHTNFVGRTESGLIKMIAIGLGNQIGAEHYHRLSVARSQYEIISKAGKALLGKANVLFGVGLVENQDHQTAIVRMVKAEMAEEVETELLKKSKEMLPTLPVEEIDLLIVDEMGKDISGEGIDPNVVGRDVCAYGAERPLPEVTRIFVRELTDASEGSALGIGQADFTTQRLVDKIDFQATAINCLTSCCPEAAKVPMTYEQDKDALAAALMTLRPYTMEDLRIVWIRNTMELTRIMVSRACLEDLRDRDDIEIEPKEMRLEFDQKGNLPPLVEM